MNYLATTLKLIAKVSGYESEECKSDSNQDK